MGSRFVKYAVRVSRLGYCQLVGSKRKENGRLDEINDMKSRRVDIELTL